MSVPTIGRWPTNGHLIADVARLGLLREDHTTLDPTYGHGTFWTIWRPTVLIGTDIDQARCLNGEPSDNFTHLTWKDRGFDCVVFDPPYKLNGTPTNTGGVDERFGVNETAPWRKRMALIRAGARECARVADKVLVIKCQDQVVSSKIRWQTRAVADEVEPLGFGLRARFDFLAGRAQPAGRRQVNPKACSSQLLVFERGWEWRD